MIKHKNIKYILLSFIALFVFKCEVNAGNATGYVLNCEPGKECGTKIDDVTYPSGNYYDNDFILEYEGEKYRAYCPDLGKRLHADWAKTSFNCQDSNLSTAQKSALSWLFSQESKYEHWIFQIAIRMLAKDMDFMKSGAINPYDIKGTGTKAADIDTAKRLANEAKKHTNELNGTVSLIMEKHTENGRNFIIKVTSNKNINDIKYTCDGCTITNTSWTGTEGYVQVQIDEKACEFTLNAYYNDASGPMWCWANDKSNQNLIFNFESDYQQATSEIKIDGNPKFKKTFKMAENNSLYKDYCDDTNQCLEQTTINIPSYCDDTFNKQITITSPKNVVQCILFNSDETDKTPGRVEQNYKMDDTQIKNDNPYCTVWCKEDYSMELPGARYSDSGRYFALSDIEVHATRSCYASGADKNTKNIDIEKFIKNAIDIQKRIVDYYNKYVIDKAKDELINGATATSNGSVCSPDSVPKDWNVVDPAGKDVTVYDITCDNDTAVCTVKPKIEHVTTSDYGNKHSTYNTVENNTTKCNNKTDSVEPEKTNTQDYLNSMTAAAHDLQAKIQHFEDCYNWKNNMCFQPEVLFRYKELYNLDFGEKTRVTHVDAKVGYKNDKTIDNKYESLSFDQLNLGTYNYTTCTSSGCSNSEVARDISTLKEKIYYLKKESTGEATYNNQKEFITNYPHGTIGEVPSGSTGPYEDYYYLGAVFPVMFKTPTGVYNWSVKFRGIGQYNNKTTCNNPSDSGRLNDVAQAIGKASIGTDLEYVCVYVVDCPECEYECECGDNPDCVEKYENGKKFCIIKDADPQCPDCEIYCKNCLFDGDGATYEWRQISLDDVNPNDRDMGSNWSNEKGEATIKAIENANESIYKNEEYSYRITAEQMKEIRDYNQSVGTYVDEDLIFHTTGNNVYGISEFLNNGESKGYFKELKRNSDWSTKVWTNIGDYQGPSW